MAATTIKNGYQSGSDDQAFVDSTGALKVTGTFSPGPGTGNVNILQVGGSNITLGQKTMANSLPVVIASDQSTINVNSTGSSTVTGNVGINGLNAFETSQTVVGTTAIQLTIPAGTSSVSIKVRTTTANDAVLVGNSNAVTNPIDGTGNGYFLFNGDSIQVDLTPTAQIWVIGTSAGQIVAMLDAGT